MDIKDVVVIGGGPAGYVAAIRAAQLGGKVALVESDKLGGTCLNRGCIPTKFLLRSVETYKSIKAAERYGIKVAKARLEPAKMQARKEAVIDKLVSGIGGLLAGNQVEVIRGRASLKTPKQVEIDIGNGEKQLIETESIIIATGAKPISLPIPGADSKDILGVDDLLKMEKPPKSLAIIGGGVIGVEMATVLANLGCTVSIVEMMPHCLPTQDSEIANVLQKALMDEGILVFCSARVNRIEDVRGGKEIVFSDGRSEQKIKVAAVAIAVGYRANTEGLGLEENGIALDNGSIQVNERMETNVPGVYGAGDAVGGMMLAYVAIAEGMVAAENAMGQSSQMSYDAVPQCIFTLPEVASVGLSEAEAIEQGYEVKVGRFPFVASGMAAIAGEQRGLVKVVAEAKYGQVLGVHIIGPQATLLIAEPALAMKLEGTVDDVMATIHSHPSLTEALWEATADVKGEALHSISYHRKRAGD